MNALASTLRCPGDARHENPDGRAGSVDLDDAASRAVDITRSGGLGPEVIVDVTVGRLPSEPDARDAAGGDGERRLVGSGERVEIACLTPDDPLPGRAGGRAGHRRRRHRVRGRVSVPRTPCSAAWPTRSRPTDRPRRRRRTSGEGAYGPTPAAAAHRDPQGSDGSTRPRSPPPARRRGASPRTPRRPPIRRTSRRPTALEQSGCRACVSRRNRDRQRCRSRRRARPVTRRCCWRYRLEGWQAAHRERGLP